MCSVRIPDSEYHANHGIYEDYKCCTELSMKRTPGSSANLFLHYFPAVLP